MRNFMMKILLPLVTASILLFSTSSFADSCEQAAYYYEKGQFKSARYILNPMVKKGEMCAEFYLGRIYMNNDKTFKKGVSLIESASKKGYPAAKDFMNSFH